MKVILANYTWGKAVLLYSELIATGFICHLGLEHGVPTLWVQAVKEEPAPAWLCPKLSTVKNYASVTATQ